jgi:hypothetical protein
MSLHIPADIVNIIFEYYAQIRDMKWLPFIDVKTGKLKWKVNKYSAKYDNINKLLKYRKDNLMHNISIDVNIMRYDEQVDTYNTQGTCACLNIEYYANDYQVIIPISKLYIEYFDEDKFKHSLFCSIFGRSTLRRFDYDVYQDGNNHSTLIDISKFSNNCYALTLEKY